MCIPASLASIDWQAIATLATGAMAVGAALWVGTKQTAIQDRQLDNQVEALNSERRLRDLEIRCNLLDRRFECIERIRKIRANFTAAGALTFEQKLDFYEAIRQAELIFPRAAIDRLDQVLSEIEKSESAARMAEAHRIRGNQSKVAEFVDLESAHSREVFNALPYLESALVGSARIELD